MKICFARFKFIFNIFTLTAFILFFNSYACFADSMPAAALQEEGILNDYNHFIFSFNDFLYSYVPERVLGLTPSVQSAKHPLSTNIPNNSAEINNSPSGFGAVLSNIVNEPITVISSLLVGDTHTAWNAASRFGINSTYGVLGWWDEASSLGYKPIPADIGLSLCRMGVGEGGYIVLPFVGPRTVRDAVADIALINLFLWSATGFLFNSGVSVQTVVIAETFEIAVDIFATRQIDPDAKNISYSDFNQMRQDYLNQRRERCSK